jgi:hypothetical protein
MQVAPLCSNYTKCTTKKKKKKKKKNSNNATTQHTVRDLRAGPANGADQSQSMLSDSNQCAGGSRTRQDQAAEGQARSVKPGDPRAVSVQMILN